MKIRLRLIRARPNFYMTRGNPNVSLRIADCSLYTRRVALKDDYHKKNGHSCIYFAEVHLFGDFFQGFHLFR